jgi:hypothetical protein
MQRLACFPLDAFSTWRGCGESHAPNQQLAHPLHHPWLPGSLPVSATWSIARYQIPSAIRSKRKAPQPWTPCCILRIPPTLSGTCLVRPDLDPSGFEWL